MWGIERYGVSAYCRSMSIASFAATRDALIAAIESDLTGEEACATIARAFTGVAPYDAAAVMTTDPETHLPAGGIVRGFDASDCVPFWDNELLDPDFNKFNDLAKSIDPVATLAEATDGDLARSPRFQKLYADAHVSDELRVAFMSGSSCLAIGAFIRCDGATYTSTEVSDVRHLLVPATRLLRHALVHMSESLTTHGPVVLIIDARGRVLSKSEGADEVLDDLRIELDAELPGTILVAASHARASRTTTRITTRLRGSSGRWVRIHVSPMSGSGGGEGDTASVTIEAAAPGDLVPILLDSYGLSDRETEIVLLVCRGIGTKEIAYELSISVHTVRDHLKAIFAKAKVNSRPELVARLFTNHLLERFHRTVTHV
jgi:DNA-binding CsgD family transcriptional regulator